MMSEIGQVVTIGTLAVLGIFFGTSEFQKIIEQAGHFGMPLSTVLSVTMLQVPTGAMYSLPAALLASVVFVLARMHRNSELLALDTLGIPRRRLIVPLLAIGIACSAASYFIGDFVAPKARYLSSQLSLLGIYRTERPFVSRLFVEFKDAQERVQNILILGNPVGKSINGFLMLDLTKPGLVNLTWSQFAQWKRGAWVLSKGLTADLLSSAHDGVKGAFEQMQIGGLTEVIKQLESKPQDVLDQTSEQLCQKIRSLRKAHKTIPHELLLQYYRRQSQPLSCLLLMLVASPMVFIRARDNRILPLVYCGILVPAYFLLQQICLSLSINGRLEPLIAAWLPTSILCAFGFMLMAITNR